MSDTIPLSYRVVMRKKVHFHFGTLLQDFKVEIRLCPLEIRYSDVEYDHVLLTNFEMIKILCIRYVLYLN